MEKYEAVVKSLQERSQHVLPLRYRRETPPQPVPVEALCEYEGEQVPSPSSSSPCAMRRCCREPSPPGALGMEEAPGEGAVLASAQTAMSPAAGTRRRSCSAPVGKQVWAAREEQGRRGLGETQASVRPADSVPITHPSGGCDSPAPSHSHAPCAGAAEMPRHVSEPRNSTPPAPARSRRAHLRPRHRGTAVLAGPSS